MFTRTFGAKGTNAAGRGPGPSAGDGPCDASWAPAAAPGGTTRSTDAVIAKATAHRNAFPRIVQPRAAPKDGAHLKILVEPPKGRR